MPLKLQIMPHKPAKKPKLAAAERHKRFLELAKTVGASDDPKAFDKAFKKVVQPKKSTGPHYLKSALEILCFGKFPLLCGINSTVIELVEVEAPSVSCRTV